MEKPNNYDETQAGGDYTPVSLGGHKMVIKHVNEITSSTGKPMIVVLFDFDSADEQAGYFMEQFKNDIRPEKKYPNQATQYILVNDSDGKTSKSFKTFTTCVEHSNTGFETQWGIKDWGKQFIGKKIGGVFGEQMDFYNGKVLKKRVLRWFTSYDKALDADIPAISETRQYKERDTSADMPSNDNGFLPIPDGISEDLPFNTSH